MSKRERWGMTTYPVTHYKYDPVLDTALVVSEGLASEPGLGLLIIPDPLMFVVFDERDRASARRWATETCRERERRGSTGTLE